MSCAASRANLLSGILTPEISVTLMLYTPSHLLIFKIGAARWLIFRGRHAVCPKADCHPIAAVHQPDRDREVDELLLIRKRGARLCRRYPSRRSQRRQAPRLWLVEETAAFLPGLHQRGLLDLHPFL